jgi:hypothetical protein
MRSIVTARMSYALIDHGESPRRQARTAAWIPKEGAPSTASRLYPASVPAGAVRAYRRDIVVRKHALLPEFRDLRSLVVVFRGDGRIAGRMYDLMPLWVGRFYAHRDAWMRYWDDESVGADAGVTDLHGLPLGVSQISGLMRQSRLDFWIHKGVSMQ